MTEQAEQFQGVRIMGIDPGMSYLGISQTLFVPGKGLELVGLHLIETQKSDKKLGVRAKADDMRRLGEIVKQVDEIVRFWPADVYAFEEAPSIAQNAAVTRKVALVWGAVYALSARTPGALCFEYGPKTLKKAVTGSVSASKDEMFESLSKRHRLLAETPIVKSKREHVTDAVAAATVAAQDQAVIQLANALKKVAS